MKKNLTKLAISILTLISVVFFVGCGSGGTGGGCDCGGTGPIGRIVGTWEANIDSFWEIVFNPDGTAQSHQMWYDDELGQREYIDNLDWELKSGHIIFSCDGCDFNGVAFSYDRGDIFVLSGTTFVKVK